MLLAFGLVLAATLHASWSTLDRYFLGDDFAYVGRFYQLAWTEWPGLFLRDWSGGLWGQPLPELRPFAALTFLWDAKCWGANPLGYHVTNLVLDTGCACLVGLIVWRLHGAALWLGCAAGILFAWHPAHAEPVAWITGRVDLLGTFAYLAGFFAGGRYWQTAENRRWLGAAWLAYGIGCFSKEFCLTLPVALLLWFFTYRPDSAPGRWRRLAVLLGGFLVVTAVFLLCRRVAFGPGGGGVAPLDLLGGAYAERQVDYLRWYFPFLYDFGRDYRALLVAIAPALVGGLVLLTVAVLALWRWKGPTTNRWRAVVCYGAGWYAIATLPLAVATYFSPRHLYLATAGLCITVGLLLATLAPRRWLAYALVVGAALFCVSRLHDAVTPWRQAAKISERLALAVTQTVPDLQYGEVLLLDVAETHRGVWLWAWAAPFALQPPFQPSPAPAALTRPGAYFAPPVWTRQPVLAALSTAPGAWLLRVDEQGAVAPRHISRLQLQAPATALARATAANQDLAWQEFITKLIPP